MTNIHLDLKALLKAFKLSIRLFRFLHFCVLWQRSSFAACALSISLVMTASVFCMRCCYSKRAPSRSGQSPVEFLATFKALLSFLGAKRVEITVLRAENLRYRL